LRNKVGTAIVVIGILCAPAAWAAGLVLTDGNGRITAMAKAGEFIEIRTNIRIPLAGWKKIPGMEHARKVRASRADGKRTWTGIIPLDKGRRCRYEQTLEEKAGAVHLAYKITAKAEIKYEGIYFWLDLPVAIFGGGRCELMNDNTPVKSAEMPEKRPQHRHFLSATANRARMAAPAGKATLDLSLDRACHIVVQDNRQWRSRTYSAFALLPVEKLARGETATLNVRLKLTGKGDNPPAALTLEASKARYKIDGFGGNYCFNIESPVSQYTLNNLRVAWARTEMTLVEWEPTNDNASPKHTNWAFLKGHDQPDTNLRREFLLAQQIQKRGIPYDIAVWDIPKWLYARPDKGTKGHPGGVDPAKWPELLECIGSYLLYAKKHYGVEPDLFSFNEPSIGVRVKFTPEEHRDAIKGIGAHFKKLGLRTKMLLGDVTRCRDNHPYVEPAAAEPETMRYVGALAFHSWGGATPEQYAAWGDLAERLKLPLLVAELGVDASAWRGRAYDTFHYALREVRMYQELLLYARPQGTMQWEFTGDYSTVRVEGDRLVPTVRFWFIKHFCDLTPPGAFALATTSDHEEVLFTAFRGKPRILTLHVANFGAARPVTITGLPAGVKSLRAIRTGATDSFKELPPVSVEGGVVKATMAPQSLLTLTTMPLP